MKFATFLLINNESLRISSHLSSHGLLFSLASFCKSLLVRSQPTPIALIRPKASSLDIEGLEEPPIPNTSSAS